eukprot:c40076_g1_i1 orf=217-525(-)
MANKCSNKLWPKVIKRYGNQRAKLLYVHASSSLSLSPLWFQRGGDDAQLSLPMADGLCYCLKREEKARMGQGKVKGSRGQADRHQPQSGRHQRGGRVAASTT